MRSDPDSASIPVLLVSGHPAVRRKAIELGAVGCLVKPIELVDLLNAIDETGRGANGRPD